MVSKSGGTIVGVTDVPAFGSALTDRLVLPSGEAPQKESFSQLTLAEKPVCSELLPVVNTLSSLDVATLIQRSSSEELHMLRTLGSKVARHQLDFTDEVVFVEKMAESLYKIQSTSIFAINNIGPAHWTNVIGNLDASTKGKYSKLSESEKDNLRSNVYSVARSFATLPEEALATLAALRGSHQDALRATEPASFLREHVIKRAVDCNHYAWRMRKHLEGEPHNDATRKVDQLSKDMRLFAGLMGLGTFQFLREGGKDVCHGLLKLGHAINLQGEIDIEQFRRSIAESPLLTGIPFKNGEIIHASRDLIQHFREAHHNLWLMNRALSWLLPTELHQPQRQEHRAIEDLPKNIANSSSVQILALAVSFASGQSDPSFQLVVKDLLNTASNGNPFDLDPGVFNSRGERI
jgi:hypothetical protein